MPVPSGIADLSQTAASNSPPGTESPTSADDYMRAGFAFTAMLRDGVGFTNPVQLASGATTSIGAQNSLFVEITGTTTITSFGTSYEGPRFLRFTGALTLTHNSTTLNLPGGSNITTAAGDTCVAIPNYAGNGWNVYPGSLNFQRQSPAARASDTVLGVSDIGRQILASGTFDQTLTAAATLGAGWFCHYRNNGAGIITIDPSGSETIDVAPSARLYPGEGCTIICDGSNFTTVGRSTGLVLIQSQTASGVATVDFTKGINSDFHKVVLEIADYLPATNTTQLRMQILQAGVVQTAAAYIHGSSYADEAAAGFAFGTGAGAETSLYLMNAVSNVAGDGVSGTIELHNPAGVTNKKKVLWDLSKGVGSDGARVSGAGYYANNNAAIDGIRLLSSSGNITSGTFKLYGVRA